MIVVDLTISELAVVVNALRRDQEQPDERIPYGIGRYVESGTDEQLHDIAVKLAMAIEKIGAY